MEQKQIIEDLKEILPPSSGGGDPDILQAEATKIIQKRNDKEIKRLRYEEQAAINRLKKKYKTAEEKGLEINSNQSIADAERIAKHKKKIDLLNTIELQNSNPISIEAIESNTPSPQKGGGRRYSSCIGEAYKLQGTSTSEIAKLLSSLNINLSIQLSKNDTANLLASLLTCNETQLNALLNNRKLPVVIKTVIKRLLDDMKEGEMKTIEMIWDRVFGKTPLATNAMDKIQSETGLLPNMPISREAYIVIRDTLIGKEEK